MVVIRAFVLPCGGGCSISTTTAVLFFQVYVTRGLWSTHHACPGIPKLARPWSVADRVTASRRVLRGGQRDSTDMARKRREISSTRVRRSITSPQGSIARNCSTLTKSNSALVAVQRRISASARLIWIVWSGSRRSAGRVRCGRSRGE